MMRFSQRGQVMPYVAVLILILTAATFVVFDIGRMINARIQSQNAADAAALAAVSAKITKHHVDTLVRAAMTQEAIIAQAEIRAAQAVAFQAFLKGSVVHAPVNLNPDPSIPVPAPTANPILGEFKELGDRYRLHANLAYKHAVKLHRERIALDAYATWLKDHAPIAVREAARIGFLSNMQGFDTLSESALAENVEKVLSQNSDLMENNSLFGEIGGFPYSNEAASVKGMFGKTLVEFQTNAVTSKSGAALLQYFDRFKLNTSAAAQVIRQPDKNQIGPLSYLTMNWYSPRLMAIEGNEPQKVAH